MRHQYNSILKRGRSGGGLRPKPRPEVCALPAQEPRRARQTPVFVYAVEISPGPDGALSETVMHGVPLELGEASALRIQCAARRRMARRAVGRRLEELEGDHLRELYAESLLELERAEKRHLLADEQHHGRDGVPPHEKDKQRHLRKLRHRTALAPLERPGVETDEAGASAAAPEDRDRDGSTFTFTFATDPMGLVLEGRGAALTVVGFDSGSDGGGGGNQNQNSGPVLTAPDIIQIGDTVCGVNGVAFGPRDTHTARMSQISGATWPRTLMFRRHGAGQHLIDTKATYVVSYSDGVLRGELKNSNPAFPKTLSFQRGSSRDALTAPKNTISYEEISKRAPTTPSSNNNAVYYDNVLSRKNRHRPRLRHQNSPLQSLTRGPATDENKRHRIRSLSDDAAQAAANATHHHDLNVSPDVLDSVVSQFRRCIHSHLGISEIELTADDVTDLFRAHDQNRDGYLSRGEIRVMFDALDFAMSEHEVTVLLNWIDVDGDGRIDLHELTVACLGAGCGGGGYRPDSHERKSGRDDDEDVCAETGTGVVLASVAARRTRKLRAARAKFLRACASGDVAAMQRMARFGGIASSLHHIRDEQSSFTPMHFAAASGRLEAVHWLGRHGALFDEEGESGVTPVMVACRMGWLEGVKFLWRNGADVVSSRGGGGGRRRRGGDGGRGRGFSAVDAAERGGHAELLEWLRRMGARVEMIADTT